MPAVAAVAVASCGAAMAAINAVTHLRTDSRDGLWRLCVTRGLDAATVGAAKHTVAAVTRSSAVPASVAAVASVEAMSAVAQKQPAIASIASVAGYAGGRRVRETVADEQPSVRVRGSAVMKENVLARGGLGLDGCDDLRHTTLLCRARLHHRREKWLRHRECLVDTRRLGSRAACFEFRGECRSHSARCECRREESRGTDSCSQGAPACGKH